MGPEFDPIVAQGHFPLDFKHYPPQYMPYTRRIVLRCSISVQFSQVTVALKIHLVGPKIVP